MTGGGGVKMRVRFFAVRSVSGRPGALSGRGPTLRRRLWLSGFSWRSGAGGDPMPHPEHGEGLCPALRVRARIEEDIFRTGDDFTLDVSKLGGDFPAAKAIRAKAVFLLTKPGFWEAGWDAKWGTIRESGVTNQRGAGDIRAGIFNLGGDVSEEICGHVDLDAIRVRDAKSVGNADIRVCGDDLCGKASGNRDPAGGVPLGTWHPEQLPRPAGFDDIKR